MMVFMTESGILRLKPLAIALAMLPTTLLENGFYFYNGNIFFQTQDNA